MTTLTNDQQTVSTIIQQLGGTGRLSAMINARNFMNDKGKLTFQFSGYKKANYIEIKLNSLDLYDISFKKFKNARMDFKKGIYHESSYTTVKEYNNIYAEDMKQFIERETGLYLSL